MISRSPLCLSLGSFKKRAYLFTVPLVLQMSMGVDENLGVPAAPMSKSMDGLRERRNKLNELAITLLAFNSREENVREKISKMNKDKRAYHNDGFEITEDFENVKRNKTNEVEKKDKVRRSLVCHQNNKLEYRNTIDGYIDMIVATDSDDYAGAGSISSDVFRNINSRKIKRNDDDKIEPDKRIRPMSSSSSDSYYTFSGLAYKSFNEKSVKKSWTRQSLRDEKYEEKL
ncbi:hypothetical protein RR46_12306 [Papilio xuthus]|uniref:Uncharacterized protein n=1 Tax=Papilio xuthus TaxID=66420 RepID=A0A194PS59_PAPXU|nr:hypothetical protein RR46_12306 [Papilio xuthus]